jgi:putative flippase GtrA
MMALLGRLLAATPIRYLGASVVALGADMGSFLLLLDMGATPAPASAASYALGIVVHWLISSRAVFNDSVAPRGDSARTRQKAMFVVSAMIGLALTTMIVGAGDAMGIDPRLAKLAAVGASFVTTWLLREKLVFRKATAA